MAGKSTFLRQNALIAVLAQMGSFVPAKRARIGVVDRLFSRVGAADDLARGRSTFMVEMVETAAILNQASERSLVILDEIGRGTATFDGLSIAWAAIEHLHETNRCRALFATHFHELTALAAQAAAPAQRDHAGEGVAGRVVFLHEVVPGAADRSYGIQVAKLAGLPRAVIERAKIVLAELEAEDRASPARRLSTICRCSPRRARRPRTQNAPDRLVAALAALHPDEMSPREAMEALYALKAKAAKKKLAPSQPHARGRNSRVRDSSAMRSKREASSAVAAPSGTPVRCSTSDREPEADQAPMRSRSPRGRLAADARHAGSG